MEEELERKLYRDPDDKIIAGVAAGLAKYFDIKTNIMRLIFLILILSGLSILVYILLWIVIPEAKSEKEKKEMRAKKINHKNLEDLIKRKD